MIKRPNIILCVCDQLRAFEVGCYRNPVVRTPNIDRLAGEGTRFDIAVSNQPVCLPSRSVILSGQYASRCIGSDTNVSFETRPGDFAMPEYPFSGRPHLPDPTLPELLGAGGYHCEAIGKWHIHSWPQDIGFHQYLIPRVHHCHSAQHFTRDGGPEFVPPGFSVDFECDEVERFCHKRAEREEPFFLYYNISPPHCPLADAPEKYLRMFAPGEVPLRPNVDLEHHWENEEYLFKVYRHDFRYYSLHLPYTEELPAGYGLRHVIAEYYGLTAWVDDAVGRMIQSLRESGLEEDTLVVFLSDHGDNLGSHRRVQKGTLNEESIRIPYVWRGPGVPGGRVITDQVGSLVDLMPSLLEMAGMETPDHVQGQSLAPVIAGSARSLEEPGAFIETGLDGIGYRTPESMIGIPWQERMGSLQDQPHYFHDMVGDPYQLNNLSSQAKDSPIAWKLEERLRHWHNRLIQQRKCGNREEGN